MIQKHKFPDLELFWLIMGFCNLKRLLFLKTGPGKKYTKNLVDSWNIRVILMKNKCEIVKIMAQFSKV
jgi:hypothetical protein